MGIWRTLHLRWILYAPGAISVHDSFLPSEPRTQALRFGAADPTDWAAVAGKKEDYYLNVFKELMKIFNSVETQIFLRNETFCSLNVRGEVAPMMKN